MVQEIVPALMKKIRPDVVALVDAFDIPDSILISTIGKYDGNVYEALLNAARRTPINQSDPFEGYEEHLKPHLDREFLSHHNKYLAKM